MGRDLRYRNGSMEPGELAPDAMAHVLRLLADEALDPSYLAFIARHLDQPDAAWRWCCGSQCDPCVQRLGRVVDRARQALCMQPPAGSGDPRPC